MKTMESISIHSSALNQKLDLNDAENECISSSLLARPLDANKFCERGNGSLLS